MPTWPPGWTGSISHKEGHCAIAVEPSSVYACLGLDIENPARVREALAEKILLPTEEKMLRAIAKSSHLSFQTLLTIVFSFKESLFKAHFTLGQTMFYFHDASIVALDWNKQTIAAKVHLDTSSQTKKGFITTGAYCLIEESRQLVATVAMIKR